jgi:hypothetical protein
MGSGIAMAEDDEEVGLKSFVVSIDYRDYMGSSSKI